MPVYVFGNNQNGQLGVPCLQDVEKLPLLNSRLDQVSVKHCSMSLHQSSIVTDEGVLLTCGANDQNLLGRSGKRSAFNRVDALETFRVRDICYGVGFCIVILSDGRIMSWGRNEMGQLGNGTRDYSEKLRFIKGFSHRIIQVAAGSEHVVALTREGNVITWGGNRKGQLGDGLFTSCCEPKVVKELRHRPVIQVTCGEEHSLALTSGGNVYSWGCNSQGQLGLGDCKNRLRAEVIRTLKAVKVIKVAAGGKHSLAISDYSVDQGRGGLLFTFGSNSYGQLGQLDYCVEKCDDLDGKGETTREEGDRMCATPIICDRLSDRYVVLDAECGKAHSVLVCQEKNCLSVTDRASLKVITMGMNTMGQCGLNHCSNVSRPTEVVFTAQSEELGKAMPQSTLGEISCVRIFSGPLANHTVVNISSAPLPVRLSIPSVDISHLSEAVNEYLQRKDSHSLMSLRELIADSYSSLAVLNASFRYQQGSKACVTGAPAVPSLGTVSCGVIGAAIGLDLFAVRSAYSLIMSTHSDQVISTLGRATLAVSDKLSECLFDDPENMSVFLIVLENPLLLLPQSYHVALQRVVSGILAIPKSYRVMFFGWLKHFPSEYFSHIVLVMQTFLSFILTDKVTKLDPTPVVMVLESLYICNTDARIIPNALFYNKAIAEYVNLQQEFMKYLSSNNSRVFNFFSYPYLLPVEAKYGVIRWKFECQMKNQVNVHTSQYLRHDLHDPNRIISNMPRGVVPVLLPAASEDRRQIAVQLELQVDRECVLDSLTMCLKGVIEDDPSSLFLPISVKFKGEADVVDEGGVTRELFHLAIRDFLVKRNCLGLAGTAGDKLFFTRTGNTERCTAEQSEEYVLGLIVGLACYNGVLVNLPLVDIVYKLFLHGQPSLDDLRSADPELAKNIKMISEYDGDDSLVTLFGVDFTASSNPLVAPHADSSSFNKNERVNLKPDGDEIYVDRANRREYVELFTRHALYYCCKTAIDDYLCGLKMVVGDTSVLSLCNSEEMEYIICGSSDIGDISELRQYTSYLGEYHDKHSVIENFWMVLQSFSSFQQRRFLYFVTATDRIPVGGLSMLSLVIQPSHQESNALPAAHTCFNILDLPLSYATPDIMKERLLTALEYSEGFGLL